MAMKNFLLGLSKFVLGIILAMLVMSIAGLSMARFFMTRMVELPERPTYENDLPESERPNPAASATERDEGGAPVAVTAAEDADQSTEDETENSTEAKPKPEAADRALAEGEYEATVNQPVGLILRDGPGTSYAQIGGLDYRQSMVVIAEEDGWLNVELNDGRTGWVKDGNIDR